MKALVRCQFYLMILFVEKVRKSRLKGSINGGGPLLKLRTSGGNVRLKMGKK